jgi:hypothetical protein
MTLIGSFHVRVTGTPAAADRQFVDDQPPVQLSASTSAEQPPAGSASTTVSVDHRLLLDLCTRAPASSAKHVLLSVLQTDKHCSANPNSFQKTTLDTSSVAPTAG